MLCTAGATSGVLDAAEDVAAVRLESASVPTLSEGPMMLPIHHDPFKLIDKGCDMATAVIPAASS